MNLGLIRNHPEHFHKILDLYLVGYERTIKKKLHFGEVASAIGIGHDGEQQEITLYRHGQVYRRYIDGWCTLPSYSGRVSSLLVALGYELPKDKAKQAQLYNRYLTTGISNLYRNERKESKGKSDSFDKD